MKVLNLRDASADAAVVELHPQLTVVHGLDPERRTWLVDSLGGLSSGSTTAEGELDVHGIRFPIEAATFALLGLDSPKPAVVSAEDLPGHDVEQDADVAEQERTAELARALTAELALQREALNEALAARIAASDEMAELGRGEGVDRGVIADAVAARSRCEAEAASAREARERLEDELGQAVTARDAATAAQELAASRHEAARDHHRERMAAASEAAAAVEEARSVAADNPAPALEEARHRLEEAEAGVAAVDPEGVASPVSRRLTELEARRAELLGLREALGPDGSVPLAAALDRLSEAPGDPAPVVAALALADTWRDLHQQLRALDTGLAPEEVAAEHRVSGAKQVVMEAEADFNQPVLTPEQITKVEAAHAAVLDAQDRSESRLGGARARKKLEALRSEERRVLERLGFSTYADYMMSSSSRAVGPANQATLDTARHQLSAASTRLSTMPGAADRARRRAELLQRRDAVAPRVAELLGHEPTGPEEEEELRRLREPVAPEEGASADLAAELEHAGVVVGPGPHDREDLELLARSYLAEQNATAGRRSEVGAALPALDAGIDVLRQAHQRGSTELPEIGEMPALAQPVPASAEAAVAPSADDDPQAQVMTDRAARWHELEGARQAAVELQSAVDRHRAASDRIAALEQELAACGEAVTSAAAAVDNADADQAASSGPALDGALAAVTEVEASLARARAREQELDQKSGAVDADGGLEGLLGQAQRRLSDAERAVTDVAAAEQTTAARFAEADSLHKAARARVEAKGIEAAVPDRTQLTKDFEWELMSRLAALRSVGIVGSVPLVLDEPFAALADHEVAPVLDRVAQMAGAVQVVVFSDRVAVADWAAIAGPKRAAVA